MNNKSYHLSQSVDSRFIPSLKKERAIDLNQFIELLRDEENYYPGEQNNTKLMITRLRKIFYDSWGWSTEVIRGAATIKGRYDVKMIKDSNAVPKLGVKNKRDKKYHFVGLVPVVVYRKDDREYPGRAGQTPEIYANDNQEVILPDSLYCDIGHILTGIDACNYPAPVTPLPGFLWWIYKLFPHVNSNMDFATWLGDIASTVGNFLFDELQNKKYNRESEQKVIDEYASGSDMLGNIDAYAISRLYNISTNWGVKVTEILSDYYGNNGIGKNYRSVRCSIFCDAMGLKGWNGNKFDNEEGWIRYQVKQLRIATAFYVYGDLDNFKGLTLALKIWLRLYEKKLAFKLLLTLFLDSLKKEIQENCVKQNNNEENK